MGTMQDPHDARRALASALPGSLHRLEVKHLRLVQAIATEGSVTRAAGRLHLSQSAVSHQLLDLERDLGTRLFDRIGKRMVSTAAGVRVLASAERLLGELALLEHDLETGGRDARVALRVTTSCYTSYHWLPGALTHFAAQHSRIDLTIVLEATRRAVDALFADEVDLAIVTAPPRDASWSTEPIVSSELLALASPEHPVFSGGGLARGALRWRDLRGATLLVHDIDDHTLALLQNAVRESWLRKSGERLARPFELRKIPLTEALIELARSGAGVVLADGWIVEPYLGRRDLVSLPFSPRAARSFHAVWRKSNPRELPIAELVDVIRTSGQERTAGRAAGAKKRPTRRRAASGAKRS